MLKNKISVCLATFNEEKNIGRCLKSADGLADEVVVVDGSSEDKTRQIAKKFGAKVFVTNNKPMFHKNKQMAMDKATGDWILLLDADEEISAELREEISSKVQQVQQVISGYWVARKNIIFGKWMRHTGWWPDYQLRLFKKGKAHLPCKSVHEDPVLQGESEKLKNPLIHHHYQSISQFLKRLDLYADNDLRIYLKNHQLSWQDAVLMPIDEFIKRFLAWEGYKDGLHGLVLSLLQAFSRFVVFAKAWEKKKFLEQKVDKGGVKKSLKKGLADYSWWSTSSKIKKKLFKLGNIWKY